jgi:hypothetical protein
MSQSFNTNKVGIINTTGSAVNPATEDTLQILSDQNVLLRRIVKLLESQAVVDVNMRQRVTLDSSTVGGTAIGTSVPGLSSGAGSPTTNYPTATAPIQQPGTSNWQPVWIGPVDQRYQIMDNARMVYDSGIRNKLAFT